MIVPPPHYFDQDHADPNDEVLAMCKRQGYVPNTCLLGGPIVWGEIVNGNDPCIGCRGPREKCHGRPFNKEARRR